MPSEPCRTLPEVPQEVANAGQDSTHPRLLQSSRQAGHTAPPLVTTEVGGDTREAGRSTQPPKKRIQSH